MLYSLPSDTAPAYAKMTPTYTPDDLNLLLTRTETADSLWSRARPARHLSQRIIKGLKKIASRASQKSQRCTRSFSCGEAASPSSSHQTLPITPCEPSLDRAASWSSSIETFISHDEKASDATAIADVPPSAESQMKKSRRRQRLDSFFTALGNSLGAMSAMPITADLSGAYGQRALPLAIVW